MKSGSIATILAAAISLGTSCAAQAAATHAIDQRGRAFHPGEIAISAGDTLVINNRDDFIHQIYVKSNAMSFDSDEQAPGTNVSVSFPAAGTFEVRCHIHPKMSLMVKVR
jgi:plastocyanin